MTSGRSVLLAVMLLLAGTPVRAASLSYFLDHSNRLTDGPNYLQVTVADGLDGAIDFTVEVLEPLLDIAGRNFGIQSFYFNVQGDVPDWTISGLPDRWRVIERGRQASEYGRFDIKIQGRGNARVETLRFSITGVEGDEPADYVLASLRSRDGVAFFAAHVAGFLAESCDGYGWSKSKGKDCTGITSAYFGGSTVVPLPGALWLIGTAFAAAALRARRRG